MARRGRYTPHSIQNFAIEGLDEIEKRLEALPEKLRRKHLRKIMTDAPEIIRIEAEARARKGAAERRWPERRNIHLADHIVKRSRVTNRYASARVGVDYSIIKHGHLVEFGTKAHKVGKRMHPGISEEGKHPFMRPAYDLKSNEALRKILNDVKAAVEKEAS